MNKTMFFLTATVLFFISSCNLLDDLNEGENDLGGETSVPINQEGNTFSTTAYVNGTYVDVPASFEITKNEDGIVKVAVVVDLKALPELSGYNDMIPEALKDAEGRLNTEATFKITSEGIQDFTNMDEENYTMVKYDCKVGDTYKLKKSDGNTITRTVTQKSTEDDFEYGLMYIKTITVEQDSRIPGINKIVYRFNHKFGLVYVEALAEDGSRASSFVYPSNY